MPTRLGVWIVTVTVTGLIHYLVLGTWYQASGTWYQVPGTRYLVPRAWYLAGTWYRVPGTRYQVPGTWNLAPDTRYEVCIRYIPCTKYQVPGVWTRSPMICLHPRSRMMLDPGSRAPHLGYPVSRCWVQDPRSRILDPGSRT